MLFSNDFIRLFSSIARAPKAPVIITFSVNMAPKAKPKPAPKANRSDKAKDQLGDTILNANRSEWMSDNAKRNSDNAILFEELVTPAINYLKTLKMFNDWSCPEPLQMKVKDSPEEMGGFMAALDKKSCVQSLANSNKYMCAMQLPHFNLGYSATPGVRLSRSQLDVAINDDTLTYSVFPIQRVAVCSDDKDFTDLTCISPEEVRIAKIVNFVRRHEAGLVSPEQEQDFKRIAYCIPTLFYVCDSIEKRFFDAIASRRETIKICGMVKRSGSQLVEEIMSVWATRGGGKVTAQKILDVFKQHLGDVAAGNDDVNESLAMSMEMVTAALLVQKTIKETPALNAVLQEADQSLMQNSPFYTITNLAAICKKVKLPIDLEWVMHMMLDYNVQTLYHWTLRTLVPKGQDSFGVIDIFLFKRQLKLQLLDKGLEDVDLLPEEKDKFRTCLASVPDMRKALGYKSGIRKQAQPDKYSAFLTGVSKSGEKFFTEVYKWIYTQEMDDTIAVHLSEKRTAKDILKVSPWVETIKAIKEEVDEQAEDKKVQEKDEEDSEDDSAPKPPEMGNAGCISSKHKIVPPKVEEGACSLATNWTVRRFAPKTSQLRPSKP